MTYDLGELSSVKVQWLLKNSNIPTRFMGLEPNDIIKKTGSFPAEIEDWLEVALRGDVIRKIGGLNTTGVGLLFDGAPGLGKTTHAVTTLMEFIRRLPENAEQAAKILGAKPQDLDHALRPIYYMTFPEFLSRKKASFEADPETKAKMHLEMEGLHGRAKEDWMNVRLLVLDDLGKEYGSKYDDTSFDEILRSRYDKALPTIVTTNVAREKWAAQYGEAMGSFAFEAFQRVSIEGKDLRRG
jgi:DNA replication protein DnaC